jgi:hypothetical protein
MESMSDFFDGIDFDGDGAGSGLGMERLAANADSTRIRLSDAVYEGVSRVPPADDELEDDDPDGDGVPGRHSHAMPDEKPDPAAQWDDAQGCWIKWNVETNAWEPLVG